MLFESEQQNYFTVSREGVWSLQFSSINNKGQFFLRVKRKVIIISDTNRNRDVCWTLQKMKKRADCTQRTNSLTKD